MKKSDNEYAADYIFTFFKNILLDEVKQGKVVQGYKNVQPHYLLMLPLLNMSIVKNDIIEIADCIDKIVKHNDMSNIEVKVALLAALEYYIINCMKR